MFKNVISAKVLSSAIIVIAILLVGSSIYTWQKSTVQTQPILPQPPTVRDISTWQTYRNNEYGFEVKYPASWKNFEKALSVNPSGKVPGGYTMNKADFVLMGIGSFSIGSKEEYDSRFGPIFFSGNVEKVSGFLKEATYYGMSYIFIQQQYAPIIAAYKNVKPGNECPIVRIQIDHDVNGKPVFDEFPDASEHCTLIAKKDGSIAILKDGSGVYNPLTAFGKEVIILTPKGFLRIALIIGMDQNDSTSKIQELINKKELDQEILAGIKLFNEMAKSIVFF